MLKLNDILPIQILLMQINFLINQKMTLIGQGGPMSKEDAEKFEKSEWFETKLKMRVWDEGAKLGPDEWKEKGTEIDYFMEMIKKHLDHQRTLKQTTPEIQQRTIQTTPINA